MALGNHPQQSIGSSVKTSFPRKRWVLVTGIIVIILAIGVGIWMVFYKNKNPSSDLNNPTIQKISALHICSTELIGESNVPLASSDQTALAPVVDKITALKDFDRDPNCLYVVLVYNIATGDAVASRNFMNKFSLVYDSTVGLSNAFTVSTIPISTLKKNVQFLEQNNSQNADNQKQDDSDISKGSDAADKFHQENK